MKHIKHIKHIYHQGEPLVYTKSRFNCLYCGKHAADCTCHPYNTKRTKKR